jgi:hypothetical protein
METQNKTSDEHVHFIPCDGIPVSIRKEVVDISPVLKELLATDMAQESKTKTISTTLVNEKGLQYAATIMSAIHINNKEEVEKIVQQLFDTESPQMALEVSQALDCWQVPIKSLECTARYNEGMENILHYVPAIGKEIPFSDYPVNILFSEDGQHCFILSNNRSHVRCFNIATQKTDWKAELSQYMGDIFLHEKSNHLIGFSFLGDMICRLNLMTHQKECLSWKGDKVFRAIKQDLVITHGNGLKLYTLDQQCLAHLDIGGGHYLNAMNIEANCDGTLLVINARNTLLIVSSKDGKVVARSEHTGYIGKFKTNNAQNCILSCAQKAPGKIETKVWDWQGKLVATKDIDIVAQEQPFYIDTDVFIRDESFVIVQKNGIQIYQYNSKKGEIEKVCVLSKPHENDVAASMDIIQDGSLIAAILRPAFELEYDITGYESIPESPEPIRICLWNRNGRKVLEQTLEMRGAICKFNPYANHLVVYNRELRDKPIQSIIIFKLDTLQEINQLPSIMVYGLYHMAARATQPSDKRLVNIDSFKAYLKNLKGYGFVMPAVSKDIIDS